MGYTVLKVMTDDRVGALKNGRLNVYLLTRLLLFSL